MRTDLHGIIPAMQPDPDILKFTTELATEAGRLVRQARAEATLQPQFKQHAELVTSADLQADALIRTRLTARFPDHAIISEESSPDFAPIHTIRTPVWIVDPIDGTVNFAHGHQQSAVSIAYVDDYTVQAAVVYNPFTDELFTAQPGQGAKLNGNPIQVSTQTRLRHALVATGFPYRKDRRPKLIRRLGAVLSHCADIRRLGSSALDICWVAAGRLDAYYESVSLWDCAAAQLIAREAGARHGHFAPVPAGYLPEFHPQHLLIASPALFEPLQELLAGVR